MEYTARTTKRGDRRSPYNPPGTQPHGQESTVYVCQSCGAVSPRWSGKCAACEAWNTLVEEVARREACLARRSRAPRAGASHSKPFPGTTDDAPRTPTGLAELDRVTGGGLVPGSAILIGGEPGIGKSTLLLQAAAAIAERGGKALYFTGEEAAAQVRLRAERLAVPKPPSGSRPRAISPTSSRPWMPSGARDLVIVDSIQTLWSDGLESAPGTVAQVRGATQALIRHAKHSGAALLLVGHVTKEGQIAGPKVIEHMVDTVLYFEGDRGQPYRILRAMKNRFGPTDEIGVFEMVSEGLREVANPSELFLGDRQAIASRRGRVRRRRGLAADPGRDPGAGDAHRASARRAAPSSVPTTSRLAMLLAVLEARCRIVLATHDVYLNVAGGLRIAEPAADLAAAAALVSSLSGVALPAGRALFRRGQPVGRHPPGRARARCASRRPRSSASAGRHTGRGRDRYQGRPP